MKIIAIAGASGGSGKSTTCIRIAEELTRLNYKSGIIELSPWPSNHLVLQAGSSIPILKGRSQTTDVAIQAALAPYKDSSTVFLLDTSRLDDQALAHWLPACTHLMITIRTDIQSIKSLNGVTRELETIRKMNPSMRFLGFLPTMAGHDGARIVQILDQAVPGYTLPFTVPLDEKEKKRSQDSSYQVLEVAPDGEVTPSGIVYQKLSQWITSKLDLTPVEPVNDNKPKETGLISRLWKKAASRLGPRVTKEKATGNAR